MDNYTYLDVYAKTYLNEIKERIKQNQITLSGERETETDEYMVEIIKSLCIKPRYNLDDKEKFVLRLLPTDSKEDTERIFITLMLYYTAVYNENIELLNKLLEAGFRFGYRSSNLDLFVLDKRISSQFNTNFYINLIKEQISLFKEFYLSLKDNEPIYKSSNPDNPVEELSIDEVIQKFANILKQNPNIAISKNKYYRNKPYEFSRLLTKKSINYFDEDIILNATEEQKQNIISHSKYMYLSKQSIARLTTLMIDSNFSIDIEDHWNEVLEELSDYELIKINELDKNIFRDVHLDISHQIYNDKKNIKNTPELFIQKVREELNKRLKKEKVQDLTTTSPKRRLLQRFTRN